MGSIEIAHIEQMYHILDLLSMRMTDVRNDSFCELGLVIPNVTYCSFNRGHFDHSPAATCRFLLLCDRATNISHTYRECVNMSFWL
jgi:hypothetical protein